MNKNGFSLLSFLLYLMLFSIIALFTTHIITTLLLPSLSATHRCKSLIALHIASDLFVRDIRMMRNKPYAWKKITTHELIWHNNDHDIGWCYTKNRLERREGTYNKSWKNTKISVVAIGIEQAIFTIENHKNRIIGVEMTLIPENLAEKAVVCYVAIQE
jgi:type II secretory pathway component PulJ